LSTDPFLIVVERRVIGERHYSRAHDTERYPSDYLMVISTCLLGRILNAVERDANKVARAGTAFSNAARYAPRLLHGHSVLNLYW